MKIKKILFSLIFGVALLSASIFVMMANNQPKANKGFVEVQTSSDTIIVEPEFKEPENADAGVWTLTFYANKPEHGAALPAEQKMTVNDSFSYAEFTLPNLNYDMDRYYFAGWAESTSLTSNIYGMAGDTINIYIDSNKSFYARWIPIYTLHADANGGRIISDGGWQPSADGSTADLQCVDSGLDSRIGQFNTLPTVETRYGYKFLGWYSNPFGVHEPLTAPLQASPNTNIYAVWEAYENSVFFDYTNGSGLNYANFKGGENGTYSYSNNSMSWTADNISGNTYSYISLKICNNEAPIDDLVFYHETNYSFKDLQIIKGSHWNRLAILINGSVTNSYFFIDVSRLIDGQMFYLSFDRDDSNPSSPVIKNVSIKNAPSLAYSSPAKTVAYGTAMGTLPAPKKDGYTFKGWMDVNAVNKFQLSLTASSEQNYHFEALLTDAKPGEKFLISIDNANIVGDGRFSFRLWDYTNNDELAITSFSGGKNLTGSIICPTTASANSDIGLLVYCGAPGYTANNSLTLDGLRVSRLTSSPTYINSSTVMTYNGSYFLLANWSLNKYTILFDANGGTGTMEPRAFTFEADGDLKINSFTRPGYEFVGWEAISSNEDVKDISPYCTLTDVVKTLGYQNTSEVSMVLKAKWAEKIIATNIYVQDTQGEYEFKQVLNIQHAGTIQLKQVAEGSTYYIANGIEYEYSETTSGQEIDTILEDDDITEINMYFKRVQYTATIKPNGGMWKGSTQNGSITGYYGAKYTLNNPTRAGYSFDGWRIDSGSATISSESLTFSTSNVQLTAMWKGTSNNIVYNVNGGQSVNNATYTTNNAAQTIKMPVPIMVGYSFTGWTIENENLGVSIEGAADNQSLIINGNEYREISLKATWDAIDYVVDVVNGSTDRTYNISSSAQNIALTPSIPTGYNFVQWNVSGDNASASVNGNTLTIPANTIGNIIVTAVFAKINYTITVDGGTANASTYNISNSNQTITLTPNNPTGYQLNKWNVSGDNASASVNGNTLTIPANAIGNIIVTAVFAKINYTITVDGGTANASTYNISNSNQTITLTAGLNPGYSLTGWDISGDNTSATIEDNSLIIIAGSVGNIVVTAKWKSSTQTIAWDGNAGLDSSVMLTQANMWNYAGSEGYSATNAGYKYKYTINGFDLTSTVSYNSVLDYCTPIPVVAGYTFEGWFTTSSGDGVMIADAYGKWVANATGYTDSYKRWVSQQGLTLYARYTPTEYAIAYDYVGGTGTNPETYSVTNSKTIANPTKRGHTFAGWEATLVLDKQNKATLLSGGVQGFSADTANAVLYDLFYIKSGVTYYGTTYNGNISWVNYTNSSISTLSTAKDVTGNGAYVVNYYPNGNTDAATNVSFNIPSGSFTTSNYKLMGKLLLKAKWTINQYTLTVKPNGGTWNNSVNDSNVLGDYGLSLTVAEPTRLGYVFTGWTFSGDGEWYEDINTYIYTDGSGSLTANWVMSDLTVSIFASPSDSESQATVIYGYNVIFTAVAKHELAITYQWYRSTTQGFAPSASSKISGATNATYTHEATTVTTYYYRCVATANGIDASSNEIKLIVNKAENVFNVDVKQGLVYNGQAQVLLQATDINDVANDIYYVVKNNKTGATSTASTSLPTAVDSGEYTVYFTVAETNNYLALEGSVLVIIDNLYTNLTIDPAGGIWNSSSEPTILKNYNGYQQSIENPTRDGYEFVKWNFAGGGTWNPTAKKFTYGIKDATLTATWVGVSYNIIIDENGGNSVSDLTYQVSENATSKDLTSSKPARGGYTFKEWKIVAGSNTQPSGSTVSGQLLTIPANEHGDITIQAIWTANDDNQIIFDENGGTKVEDMSFTTTDNASGQQITLPTAITRNGYTFGGWEIVQGQNSIPTGSTIVGNSKTTLSIPQYDYSNITLKAIWTGNTYDIVYQSNNGKWSDGATIKNAEYTTAGTSQTIALLNGEGLTRDGYTFGGWKISINSEPTNSTVTGMSKVSLVIPANDYGNITLDAIWVGRSYKIEFNENGGNSVSDLTYVTKEDAQTLDLTSKIPTRNGYTFNGWTFVAYSTPVSEIQGNKITIPANAYGNMTIRAEWKGITYTISYDTNSGNWKDGYVATTTNYTTTESEQTIDLPTVENISRNGYTFGGWKVVANSVPTGSTVTGDNKTTLTIPANDYNNITLKAIWNGITYNINYNTVLGTFATGYTPVSTYTTQEATDYQIIGLPAGNKISRNGYRFASWIIEVNSTPASEIVGTDLKIVKNTYGDITVKATWESLSYTITYNVNGGKWNDGYVSTPSNYLTNPSAQTLALPTSENISREGYTFKGWEITTNTSPTQSSVVGNDKVDLSIPANDYGNIALRAIWSINSYTLTLDLNYDGDNKVSTPDGNTAQTVTQNYDTKYTPASPIREGYTFVAWTLVDGAGSYSEGVYTFGAGNAVLSAQWTVLQYSLTVKPNGGKWANGVEDASTQDQTITQNYGTSLQINNPTRNGYNFEGWTHVGGGKLENGIYTFGAENATLTAKWTGIQYTITITGGTCGASKYQTAEQKQEFTLKANTRNGYTFVGWNLAGSDNLQATATDTTLTIPANTYGNITIVAEYEINTYTITYVVNDGTWADGFEPIATYTVESDDIILPTADNIVRTGYTFDGWKLKSDLSGSSMTKITSGSVGNVKVYAKWTINQYTLTRDLNRDDDFDSTTTTGDVQLYIQDYNTVKNHEGYATARRGYKFAGWVYEGDGLFEQYDDGSYQYTFTGDGKITATWEETSYTLTLDYQGGTVSHLDSNFTRARDYTYDIYELPENYDPTLTGGAGSAAWELGISTDYAEGYINLLNGTGFNGDRSLYVRVDQPGTKWYNRRIVYSLNRRDGGLPFGTYHVSLYVKTDKPTDEFVIYSETYYEGYYHGIQESKYCNLTPNVWHYVETTFEIKDISEEYANLMFFLEVGTTYQLDDIKLVRLTDENGNPYDVTKDTVNPVSVVEFDYTTDSRRIPNAVKPGYTFLGWNTEADGSGTWETKYAGYHYNWSKEMTDRKYYAIYKLSNPTAVIGDMPQQGKSTNDMATPTYNMVYNKDATTLTANVNTEGLAVDKTNYQWHVSTTPNFTPSTDTAITGATSRTFVHQPTFKNVGTYYYACVVSVEKDGETSAPIASNYATVVIDKGEPSATITMSNYIYSETPSVPQCTANISGGAITYYYNTTKSTTGGTEWKDITSTTLNVGTYYMYATIAETGNFEASVSNIVEFKVISKELTKPTITGEYIYNRTEQTASIQGFDATKMAIVDGSVTKATDNGTYTITIALLDKTYYNYTWEDDVTATHGTTADVVLTWTIAKYDLANVSIANVPTQRYTTFAIEPKPTVTATELDNYVLVENTDFEFSYKDNIEVGFATITITGKGNYTGTNSITFEIKGEIVDKPTIKQSYKYNATEQEVTIDGFNANTMTIVDGSVIKATNAGTYTITIALKEYYTWRDLTRDDITLTWEIDKADVTLTAAKTSIAARVGETVTNDIAVATSYGGSLDGQELNIMTPPYMDIDKGNIQNNNVTLEMSPIENFDMPDTINIIYTGDENHNVGKTEFEVTIIPIYVDLVIHGSGSASIDNELDGSIGGLIDVDSDVLATSSGDGHIKVAINSDIAFTATPSANNGLIKYSVQNITTYMEKTSGRKLTDSFTSGKITVSDTLLGNTKNSIANNVIKIELWFDKVVNVTLDTDATQTGATSHTISTLYEGQDVNFAYDEATKMLTAFESAQLSVDVTANKIGDQYYIINKVTIDEQTQGKKALNTTIETDLSTLIENPNISVQAVKVFNADDKSVEDKSASVGTLKINANAVDAIEIEQQTYVIENAPVDIQITTTNNNYDFLAIKVDGVVMLKGQFEGLWEHDGNVSTWKAQQYTKELSEIEAIILEKWYTAGDAGRTVEVKVAEGIDAKLVNTDIGYSYTLADDIFDVSGGESLYVGNWKVQVESANVTNYQVKVTVKTGSSVEQVYGKDETFKIDSTITKVTIEISIVPAV